MQTVEESNQLVQEGCIAYDMGSTMQWLRIEVSIFYVNLLVLIFYLLRAVTVRDVRDMKKREKFENKFIMDHIADKIDHFGKHYGEDISMILLNEKDETEV